MDQLNLKGKWSGYYKYGKAYPANERRKKFPFILVINSQDTIIKGTCEDDISTEFMIGPASIEGVLHEARLQFVKKYSCAVEVDESGKTYARKDQPAYPVWYEGFLQRKFFSRKYYFSGKWTIEVGYVDEKGEMFNTIYDGTWRMQRIE